MDEPKPAPKPAAPPEEDMPDAVIEEARSGRSKCKGCRRAIAKGALRVGFLLEGPFGKGYLWHHLACAARRRPEDLDAAYEASAWENAKVPPTNVPDLAKIKATVVEAEAKKATRQEIPYAELDPSGRAKCKQCEQPLEKGAPRVALGRKVEFGNQIRVAPINVHVSCVIDALEEDDCDNEAGSLAAGIRANSTKLSAEQIEEILTAIGDLSDPDTPSDS